MKLIITAILPMMATLLMSAGSVDEIPTDSVDSIPLQQLDEVVVKARRPEAIVTAEKMSFNPAATLSGNNGSLYDALTAMPGVSVNGGSVSANGQNGVTVMVNGRKLMLQGSALESYIRSVPSSNIERIELVSAPTAKSDASSSTTVLNIRLRKVRNRGVSFGLTGSAQGWRAKRALGTTYVDYSSTRTSIMASGSLVAARNPSLLHTDRPYLDQDLRILQVYHRDRRDLNKNASVYIDHTFSDRWTAGGSFSGNWFNRRELGIMDTRLSNEENSGRTTNLTHQHNSNILAGIYLKDTFEGHCGELNIGFDHFRYSNNEKQDISDTLTSVIEGNMGGCIKGYVATCDFTKKLTGSWSLSSGLKSTLLRIDKRGRYDERPDGNGNLSSSFDGRENVNAVYLESRYTPHSRVSLTAGARVEQTNVRNLYRSRDTGELSDYRRHTAGLFINASVGYQPTERDGYMISYARRVKRPKYNDLNPFVYILDDITHVGGNINLREAISDNIQVVYCRENWLRCSLSGTYIRNDIVRYFREVSDKTVFSSPENLPRHLNAIVSASVLNVSVTRWGDISGTLSVVYDDYSFSHDIGTENNRGVTPMFDIRCRLDPKSDLSAEVSYKWCGRTVYGQTEIAPMGSLYIGMKYTVPGDKITVTLFSRDILNTNFRRNLIWFRGRESRLEEKEYEDMRQIGLTVSYRFNYGTRKHKKRENKIQEEINRVYL